jgi:hypothetical protein
MARADAGLDVSDTHRDSAHFPSIQTVFAIVTCNGRRPQSERPFGAQREPSARSHIRQ